jgi:hypothetical protein
MGGATEPLLHIEADLLTLVGHASWPARSGHQGKASRARGRGWPAGIARVLTEKQAGTIAVATGG